jgi:hypothetical protein
MKFDFSATPEQITEQYKQLHDASLMSLLEAGIRVEESLPLRNSGNTYHGEVPDELDQLTTAEIAELMSLHLGWTKYINSKLAESEAQVKTHKVWLEGMRSALKRANIREDHIESDVRYMEISSNQLFWEIKKMYLESLRNSASVDYKTISRQITLRGLDQDQHSRINTLSHRREKFGVK